jgi:hypothetical protein
MAAAPQIVTLPRTISPSKEPLPDPWLRRGGVVQPKA